MGGPLPEERKNVTVSEQRGERGVSRDSDRQKGQMDEQAKGPRIIYKVAAA